MVDKLREYFDEMVVYKDLKNNFFSSLGLPAFLRDYLLKTFACDLGKKRFQTIWLLRWNTVPSLKPSIVDTFF